MNLVALQTQKFQENSFPEIDWKAMIEFDINSRRSLHDFYGDSFPPEVYNEWLHNGTMKFYNNTNIDKLLKSDMKTIEFDVKLRDDKIHFRLIDFHVTQLEHDNLFSTIPTVTVSFTCSKYMSKRIKE